MASKQDLLHFLDTHVFNPILRTSPNGYREPDRAKLEDVQKKTKSEKERFHSYKSAEEIITNYKRDLHSTAAKHVHAELERLRLATLPSVKDDFLKEAGEE